MTQRKLLSLSEQCGLCIVQGLHVHVPEHIGGGVGDPCPQDEHFQPWRTMNSEDRVTTGTYEDGVLVLEFSPVKLLAQLIGQYLLPTFQKHYVNRVEEDIAHVAGTSFVEANLNNVTSDALPNRIIIMIAEHIVRIVWIT